MEFFVRFKEVAPLIFYLLNHSVTQNEKGNIFLLYLISAPFRNVTTNKIKSLVLAFSYFVPLLKIV